MDKFLTETSLSTTGSTEKRALTDVVQTTKRPGGNYGSLAKSQLQPNFYIFHKVESDDTLQRLALKYSVNVQEIKRVNKLWSDAELRLLENVFIPVHPNQLATLRSLHPMLNIVQNASPTMNRTRKSSTSSMPTDEFNSSLQSSDSSASIPTTASAATTMTTNAFHSYFSKIDQQINSSKKSLQSLDIDKKYVKSQKLNTSYSSYASNGNNSDDSTSSQTSRTKMWSNGRNDGAHRISDSNVFVSISSQNSRDKHVSAALERIQREKDNFDEL